MIYWKIGKADEELSIFFEANRFFNEEDYVNNLKLELGLERDRTYDFKVYTNKKPLLRDDGILDFGEIRIKFVDEVENFEKWLLENEEFIFEFHT